MDLVVTGTPNSQTMAFDVTVVNPVAPSASGPEVVRAASPGTAMDEVERRKQMKYEQACKRVGWTLKPMVFDTFGATNCSSVTIMKGLIHSMETKSTPVTRSTCGSKAWQTITTAVITRSAIAWANVTNDDNPHGLRVYALDWVTAACKRLRRNDSHRLSTIPTEGDDMSNLPMTQLNHTDQQGINPTRVEDVLADTSNPQTSTVDRGLEKSDSDGEIACD